MTGPLQGVRVLEVASHVFVPIAGAVLTEWGADTVKIEHPVTGDPYRGLVTQGLHKSYDGVDPSFQFTNRGKRSVSLDLKTAEGRNVLLRLATRADVFLTNFRPAALRRLRLDVDDVRAVNPDIVYVRGTGYGVEGPDAERGGYDGAAYWARGGPGAALTPHGQGYPIMQRPAFGDVMGGLTIAGAIAAAMYRRATTGEPSVVDVSLLGLGLWQVQPDVIHAQLDGGWASRPHDRKEVRNPLSNTYRTRDGRFIVLMMLDADRYWPDFCAVTGRPDLLADPRFADMDRRRLNARALVELLDALFAERDQAEWCAVLAEAKGVWAPFQTPAEVAADPQVTANRYVQDVAMGNGTTMKLVTSPVRFDGDTPTLSRAPEHGEHTEQVLLESGFEWNDFACFKDAGTTG